MNYETYQTSRNAAWEILLACGVDRLPVDLNAVTRHLGVRVYSYGRGRELLASTGLEALFGYLYLEGRNQRIQELFDAIWQAQMNFEPKTP